MEKLGVKSNVLNLMKTDMWDKNKYVNEIDDGLRMFHHTLSTQPKGYEKSRKGNKFKFIILRCHDWHFLLVAKQSPQVTLFNVQTVHTCIYTLV